jgi:hypothetical protein
LKVSVGHDFRLIPKSKLRKPKSIVLVDGSDGPITKYMVVPATQIVRISNRKLLRFNDKSATYTSKVDHV